MKITASWVKLAGTRRPIEGLQYREIRHLRLLDEGGLEITAEGIPPRFAGWDHREEPKKLLIADITSDDLIELYLQIQRRLIERNVALPDTRRDQAEAASGQKENTENRH